MKKIYKQISSIIPNESNYRIIENKLDFSSLGTNETKKPKLRKAYIAFPVTVFIAAGIIFGAIFIPKAFQETPSISNNDFTTIHPLKRIYTERDYEIQNQWAGGVDKIDSWKGFKNYINGLKFAKIADFEGEINEAAFEDNYLFCVNFLCCKAELEANYDGKGPTLEEIILSNNELLIKISVPRIGYTEDINRVIFYALIPNNKVNENYQYTYDITQRDTGKKGSSYYL